MASIACPHCSAQIPAQAQFCGGCGARLQMEVGPSSSDQEAPISVSGFLPPGQGTPICPECGAIAPPKLSRCQVCGVEYGAHPPGSPEVGNQKFWVQIRAEFQCRSCGYFVPLNYLDVDGSVLCIRCGVDQVFDVEAWQTGLTAAHEVGDLAGPNPEGRFPNPEHSIAASNTYKRIGVDAATATSKQSSTSHRGGAVLHRSLIVTAAPGFPLCDDCKAPLSVTTSGLHATMTCAGCGTEAQYETPAGGADLYHSLVAAVAPEHRTDAADALEHESSDGAALAVRCPNCNGPISVDGESYFENCGFCHTPVRIREATMRKLVSEPHPLPWWMLFRGPSKKRIALEHHVALTEGKSRGKIEQPPVRTSKLRQVIVAVLFPLAALLFVAMLGIGDGIAAWFGDTAQALAGLANDRPAHRTRQPTRVARPQPVQLPTITKVTASDCRCRIGKKRAQMIAAGKSAGDGWQLSIGMTGTPGDDVTLSLDESTAPPASIPGHALPLGLGCDRKRVYLAWQDRVTAYSIRDGSRVWTASLARPFREPKVYGRLNLDVRCKSLKIKKRRLRVPIRAGKTARVRVSDGAVK